MMRWELDPGSGSGLGPGAPAVDAEALVAAARSARDRA